MTITYARTTSLYDGVGAGMSASIPIADTIVASSNNFTIPPITGTITSWLYNEVGDPHITEQREARFVINIRIEGIETGQFLTFEKGYLSIGASTGWVSKSWTDTATTSLFQTSRFFKAANKTRRTLTITLSPAYWELSTYNSDYSNNSTPSGTVALMLDVPPTATLGTPTYATPQYAGLGAYTVPITSAEAYYGGDISKVTLTVGQDSTVQTYSTPTISNQTISVTPTMAGTYTPTVTIEDSRGQIATYTLPQITVNPYNVPSVSFDVYRTNNIGIKNDEGHYALIQSTISYTDAIATLTEPSIQIDGVDLSSLANASVTWYKTWSNTSGVSNVISNWTTLVPQNHTVTIYGLIDWKYNTTGNFAEDTSYQITLVANDSLNGHSAPITQTMSTAFYTIDFQAGGKEIAFGAPANDNLTSHPNGLFKCAMDAQFGGSLTLDTALSVANGGTGAKTAAAARAKLGVTVANLGLTGAETKTLLWENARPTSAFGAQNIDVSNIDNFDFVEVFYRFNINENNNASTKVISGNTISMQYGWGQSQNWERKITVNSNTSLHFESAVIQTVREDNAYIIPLKIYGIKEV